MTSAWTRIAFGLILPASQLIGCSSQSSGLASTEAPVLTLSSHDLYAKIANLPKTGSGSLGALYSQVGAMTFTNYFKYLDATAADSDINLDNVALGNAKKSLASHSGSFAVAGMFFPTVGEWWKAIGYEPNTTLTETEFTASLARILHQSSLGLVGSEASSSSQAPGLAVTTVTTGGSLNGEGIVGSCQDFNQFATIYDGTWIGIPRQTAANTVPAKKSKGPLTAEQCAYLDQQLASMNGPGSSFTVPAFPAHFPYTGAPLGGLPTSTSASPLDD